MSDYPTVLLRYFDVRGRAQLVRNYLLCRGIPFEDDRVSLSRGFESWQAIRENRAVTGPFQKLPVLWWGERMVAETTVIARFLHEASGDAALLSEDQNLRHEMLISSCYVDLMMPIGILLWSEFTLPGVDLGAMATRGLERAIAHLAVVDRTLEEWQWLERADAPAVMVADCFLWDQLNAAQHVFGAKLSLDATPTIARFYRDCPGRGVFERLLETKPCQLTGRPGEAEAIAKIRSLLDSA